VKNRIRAFLLISVLLLYCVPHTYAEAGSVAGEGNRTDIEVTDPFGIIKDEPVTDEFITNTVTDEEFYLYHELPVNSDEFGRPLPNSIADWELEMMWDIPPPELPEYEPEVDIGIPIPRIMTETDVVIQPDMPLELWALVDEIDDATKSPAGLFSTSELDFNNDNSLTNAAPGQTITVFVIPQPQSPPPSPSASTSPSPNPSQSSPASGH